MSGYAFNPRPAVASAARRSSPPQRRSVWFDVLTALGGGYILGTAGAHVTYAIMEAVQNFFSTEKEKIESETLELETRRVELTAELDAVQQKLIVLDEQYQKILVAEEDAANETPVDAGY